MLKGDFFWEKAACYVMWFIPILFSCKIFDKIRAPCILWFSSFPPLLFSLPLPSLLSSSSMGNNGVTGLQMAQGEIRGWVIQAIWLRGWMFQACVYIPLFTLFPMPGAHFPAFFFSPCQTKTIPPYLSSVLTFMKISVTLPFLLLGRSTINHHPWLPIEILRCFSHLLWGKPGSYCLFVTSPHLHTHTGLRLGRHSVTGMEGVNK